jgi:hypothetical protein
MLVERVNACNVEPKGSGLSACYELGIVNNFGRRGDIDRGLSVLTGVQVAIKEWPRRDSIITVQALLSCLDSSTFHHCPQMLTSFD